jgi:hypothetical protein
MPITWQVNDTGRVDVVFLDPYSMAESERVMKDVYADKRPSRPLRFLVDVRHSTPPDTEFVSSAITFWQLNVKHMWDAKVAVIASTDRQVGMGQMSERTTESRKLPFTIRVFRESEREEAEKWLDLQR